MLYPDLFRGMNSGKIKPAIPFIKLLSVPLKEGYLVRTESDPDQVLSFRL